MKKTRKLISLLMALAMIFALAIPAFAASSSDVTSGTITIDNAVVGETYTIYQIFEVTYSDSTGTGSYSYKVTEDWKNFFAESADGADYITIDDNGYITDSSSLTNLNVADFAKAALKYAQDNEITNNGSEKATASGEESTTTVVFDNLSLGYYLVDTSLGTLCSIDTTNPNATIEEKNDTEPTFEKTVGESEQNNTASIGDTLTYTITIGNVANKSSVKVSDTLSDGLTLDTDTIKVTVGGNTVDASEATYYLDTVSDENGFNIVFYESYLEDMTDTIVITYSATINENAAIYTDTNTNTAVLKYGNQSKTDVVETKVYEFELEKVDGDGESLDGAEFTLKDSDGNDVKVSKQSNDSYKVDPNGADTITVGKAKIIGLAAGTYTLTETKAPDGYNKLKDPVTITINDNGTVTYQNDTPETDNVVTIENQAGTELPSTGGMGTTLFYIFGGALVLCAVVLLVTRRRMDNEQ